MKDTSIVDNRRDWLVEQQQFDSLRLKKHESILAQGNGYMGIRAAYEEGYTRDSRGAFIAGIYNRSEPNDVEELANIADMCGMDILLDKEPFSLLSGKLLAFYRYLDLRDGQLVREVQWQSAAGLRYHMVFRRFVSLDNLHLAAIRVTVTPLDADAEISVTTGINGQITNSGSQHFLEGERRLHDGNILHMTQTTSQTGIEVALSAACTLSGEASHSFSDVSFGVARRSIYGNYSFNILKGQSISFEKIMCVHTSLECEDAANANLKELRGAMGKGYDALYEASRMSWGEYWNACEIDLCSENPMDLLALRFAQYHLRIMTPFHTSRVSIAGKGLTGEGYKGHVFWDCEIFLLPYFRDLFPETARSLLEYRYRGLAGAREKAKEKGYRGAMYPWEATGSGQEETPYYGMLDIVTGKPNRAWAGEKEHHVTADIAYSVQMYYRHTGDDAFMERYGYEILFECAAFWVSRAEYIPDKDRYEIRDVIGPDEYTEHIDNNTYTNYMALFTIEIALEACAHLEAHNLSLLERLDKMLGLCGQLALFRRISEKLYFPPSKGVIIAQDDSFFQKDKLDIKRFRQDARKQAVLLHYSREEVINRQVLKQPDVLMLPFMFPERFFPRVTQANWEYYEPKTINDSSLSHGVHCVTACQFGEIEKAYQYYQSGSTIDIGDNPFSCDDGIHAGAMGAVWIMLSQGFGGIHVRDGRLSMSPCVPVQWSKLRFPFWWQGQKLHIELTAGAVRILAQKTTGLLLYDREVVVPADRWTEFPAKRIAMP